MEDVLKEILTTLQDIKASQNRKLTYTIDECVAVSGIGKHTLLEEVYKTNSDFPYFKVGNKIRVDREMFEAWIKKNAINHIELRRERLTCVK